MKWRTTKPTWRSPAESKEIILGKTPVAWKRTGQWIKKKLLSGLWANGRIGMMI